MKRLLKWTIRVACIFVGLAVVLLIVAFFIVNSASFQKKLLQRTTDILEDKLQTSVQIDSVSIDLLTLDAELYRLCVEDRQQRKMLQMDYLQADMDTWALLNHKVRINEAKVVGLRAELHHDSIDTVANYQFVIDAFKKDPHQTSPRGGSGNSPLGEKKGGSLTFIMNRFIVEDVHVSYNNYTFSLDKLLYTQKRRNKTQVSVEQLSAQWDRINKKGWLVSNDATIGKLLVHNEKKRWFIDVDDLHFRNDNHHPRKNAGKPKRGFFDLQHLNVYAHLKAEIDYAKDGIVQGQLTECTARDTIMGIDIRDLHTTFSWNKQRLFLRDFVVRQINTELRFAKGYIMLPSKKQGRTLAYRTSTITGRTQLKDISRTFAPVLKDFTMPLNLSVRLNGNDNSMTFSNIKVATDDRRLTVGAHGNISNLKDKYKLRVHFDVDRMAAEGSIKEAVIKQFPVKRFMMKQLDALGTLHYKGAFNVLWKKVEFQGNLGTMAGVLKFHFAIDGLTKYLSGNASTEFLEIGKVMDMPQIGPVAAEATFKIDISKPRTAVMRKRLGGKLPIGEVKAHVSRASYKFVTTKNLDIEIVSDGAVAVGSVKAPGKLMDLNCTFSFTNTNEMHKMKITPAVKVHLFGKTNATPEEKAAQEALLRQKLEEKDAIKAAKIQYKAEKKQRKAEEKQRKAEEKAARKAARKAAKTSQR